MASIGIFGGAFDPVHFGHLRTAYELLTALKLDEVRFVPSGMPPHRDLPSAGGDVRRQMVEAAIAEQPGFTIDDRELKRPGTSYSIDTLSSLRDEYPDASLCLLIGMDAFTELPTWHRWQEIVDLAHIVVAHRPGWQPPERGQVGELLKSRATAKAADLTAGTAGCVYVYAVTQLEISSSAVRELVGNGGDPRYLVPRAVAKIIRDTGCYAPRHTPGSEVRKHA